MKNARIDSREGIATGWVGAREEAQLPARVRDARLHAADAPAPRSRGSLRFAFRIVRDAAIAVALMTLVPVGIVGIWGDALWRTNFNNTAEKTVIAERSRSLALATDPAITPARAGLAFGALLERNSSDVPAAVASPLKASWRTASLTREMFPTARPVTFINAPSTPNVLEAAMRGFTPEEMAFLKTLSTAPVWKEFDVLVRAPAVDMVGGRFSIPFAAGVNYYSLPGQRFGATKEMAYAAVSRAAWHLGNGRLDSAETVLRSITSYGFVLIDNGTTVMDELIGDMIVVIGRDALQRFYVVTGNPRAASAAVSPARDAGVSTVTSRLSGSRAQVLTRATDPSVNRGERFEALGMLSLSPCSNVRELMFGARTDVSDAFRRARQDLARYPAEQALLDLEARRFDGLAQRMNAVPYGSMLGRLAASSAAVAGTVLQNPRLLTCTRLMFEGTGIVY